MTTRAHAIRAGLMVAVVLCLAAMGCSSSGDSTSATQAATGRVPDDEIRIGLQGPLTGDQSGVGSGMLRGAQLAATELNDAGGIDGRMITIVEIDDQADPETGVSAATAAIADGLSAVIGPYNSGVGADTLPLYIDAGLVPLRLTSADETQGLGFTLQPMTSQIAPVATIAISEWMNATSVALIYDGTADYTVEANTAMADSLDAGTGNREPAPVVVLSSTDDGTLHLDEDWSAATGYEF